MSDSAKKLTIGNLDDLGLISKKAGEMYVLCYLITCYQIVFSLNKTEDDIEHLLFPEEIDCLTETHDFLYGITN